MIQTPAQAGNRASKPEHYHAVVGKQLRMISNLASPATCDHKQYCSFFPHQAGPNKIRYCEVANYLKTLFTLLDLCVSSLRRGHANLLCIVPTLTDAPRTASKKTSDNMSDSPLWCQIKSVPLYASDELTKVQIRRYCCCVDTF